MWSCILVWLGAKKTVTNAKWANLFPFFTKSTLDISKAELASFDWAFLVEWINIVVQLSLDSFLKGDPFPYWFVARFSHWFLLEVPNNHLSTGKPWSHPSRKYFNLPSFPTKHHFLCYILFFRKATEMSPTYKTFVPLPSWRSRFVYAEDELGFFCNFINSFLKSFSH